VFSRPNDRCSHGSLQAIFKPAPDAMSQMGPRLGLVIAKRFLPLAVQRNRVKRLIREGFRSASSELPAVDIIVRLARKPQAEVNAGDVAALFGKMQRSETNPRTR